MTEIYFDEIIKVLSIEDKVHDKVSVSRVAAKSEEGEFYLELDVHTSLYSMLPGERYKMMISNSLHLDGSSVTDGFPEGRHESLADKFEFVMHGVLYKISEAVDSNTKVVVHISFGGFQLMLKDDLLKMYQLNDRKLFLLLRKM